MSYLKQQAKKLDFQSVTAWGESAGALAGTSTESLPGPEGVGRPEAGASVGTGPREGDVRDVSDAGDESVPGRGTGDEGISVPAKRKRARRKPKGTGNPVDHAVTAADQAASNAQTSDQIIQGAEIRAEETNPDSGKAHALTLTGDFFVEDVDSFSAGSLKQKYQRNIDAIVTLRRIQSDGRAHATPEEQATLARYIGWGQFPGIFNEYTAAGEKWDEERAALKGLLSAEEYRSAKASIKNAHYTAPQIVDAMWNIARSLGFTKGRVLEPSMGSGNFFALMPRDIRKVSPIVGIELDKTTGQIAQLLYPNADIQIKGYEEYPVSDNFFDLITSNFPFGDYQVADPRYPQSLKSQIHDYFFVKSLDKVRPGGLIVGITSTGTMDKGSEAVRRHLAEGADLVGAIRLPSNTFQKEAGTAVVTDIVILRKRVPGEESTPELERIRANKWLNLKQIPDSLGGLPLNINEYFAAHPEMVIGQLGRSGEMFGSYKKDDKGAYVLDAQGNKIENPKPMGVTREDDFEDHFQEAISSLPQGIFSPQASTRKAFEAELLTAPDEVKQGSFVVRDGKVYQKTGAHLIEQQATPETVKRVTGMIEVRDVLNRLFNAELQNPEAAGAIRAELNEAYDAFVKKHGQLHDKEKPEGLRRRSRPLSRPGTREGPQRNEGSHKE